MENDMAALKKVLFAINTEIADGKRLELRADERSIEWRVFDENGDLIWKQGAATYYLSESEKVCKNCQ